MWDNLTCWQAASIGEVVVVNCPEVFHALMGPDDGDHFYFLPILTGLVRSGGADVFIPTTICLFVSEMGRVHRNCTEDGWSEPMPHYVDACIFYDNATKPVRERWHASNCQVKSGWTEALCS